MSTFKASHRTYMKGSLMAFEGIVDLEGATDQDALLTALGLEFLAFRERVEETMARYKCTEELPGGGV